MATNETTIKTDLPLLILRLVLGITMVMHGVQKAQMGFAGRTVPLTVTKRCPPMVSRTMQPCRVR